MRGFRALILVGLVLLVAVGTLANPIPPQDPTIIIRDPNEIPIPVTGLQFSIFSDANGMGITTLQNQSQVNWFNLLALMLAPNGVTAADVICGGTLFAQCVATDKGPGPGGTNLIEVFFFGTGVGGNFIGIPEGLIFHIDLTSINGNNGWEPNAEMRFFANIPEPGTMTLLLTGVGALLVRRRTRKIIGRRA